MFKSKPASSRLRLIKENCLWLLFFLLMRILFLFFIIYLWVYWLLVAVLRLLVVVCRLLSSCGVWAPVREGSVAAVCRLGCKLPGT